MNKWNKLRDFSTEKRSSSRITVMLCVIIGIIIASGLFGFSIYAVEPAIKEYLNETNQIINLYDFYDLKVGKNQTAVYFLGSSIMAEAIYTPSINSNLSEKGYDIRSYNLVYYGDTPLQRSLEIQKIIDGSPSLVIYGLTYRCIYDEVSWPDERVSLVWDRLDVRDDALYLYSKSELENIGTRPSITYNKKFLISALTSKIFSTGQTPTNTLDYLNDPYGVEFRKYIWEQRYDPEQIILEANDPNNPWHPVITNDSTRYKEALIYDVQTIMDAEIPVIIINMPLHPLFSEKITDESRENFYSLLNETGATWYDMERNYDASYFYDGHHMTYDGALEFAPVMADLIISEVKSGAVHYA